MKFAECIGNLHTALVENGRGPDAAVPAMLVLSGTHAMGSTPHADAAQVPAYAALDDDHRKYLFHQLLERVDTDQGEQMRRIDRAALSDLDLIEREALAQRAPRAGILLAETLDRAALEKIRVAEMTVADKRTHRVDELLIDLAAVMTPWQRAQFKADVEAIAN